jgi:ABC-type lipoprotein release transport system permease subunit
MTRDFTIKLAWRNIWRQKRRTLITAAAIATAMLLSLFMRSMQEGSYAQNLDNATRLYSGYMQLQEEGFAENKSIDHLLPANDDFLKKIQSINGLTYIVPRIESFALAGAGQKSKGVMVMGVDPKEENAFSRLQDRVKEGRYFQSPDEQTALVGRKLAEHFEVTVGDEIVLYGQGYHGMTAAGVYKIGGIIKYPNSQMEARIVFLPLKTAQGLYVTGDQVTAWVLQGKNVHAIPSIVKEARAKMPDFVAVKTWDEISPELAQQIALDRAGGQFMVAVLYGVVGFSLFATIVMMTLERRREFAVMLATGMVRLKLQTLVITESLFLTLTGVFLGFIITTPILAWFYFHPIQLTGDWALMMEEYGWEPIIPFSLDPTLFIKQTMAVIIILAFCVIYPIVRIKKMPLAEALKG